LDEIFGELADSLHTDEEDIASMYRHALKVHGARGIRSTPKNPTE
jgi:hypothetical protein